MNRVTAQSIISQTYKEILSDDFARPLYPDEGFAALVGQSPLVAKWAILIRKYGQEIIKATGGRKVHATSAVPGGFNQNLSIENRNALRTDLIQITGWTG